MCLRLVSVSTVGTTQDRSEPVPLHLHLDLSQKETPMIVIIDKRKAPKVTGTFLMDIPWGTVFSGRIGSHHGIWLATALGVVQFASAGSSSFPTKENKDAGTKCIDYKTHVATLTIE